MKTNLHGRHEGLLPQGLAKDHGIADLQYLHEVFGHNVEKYREVGDFAGLGMQGSQSMREVFFPPKEAFADDVLNPLADRNEDRNRRQRRAHSDPGDVRPYDEETSQPSREREIDSCHAPTHNRVGNSLADDDVDFH